MNKYKSKFEKAMARKLRAKGVKFEYETLSIPYVLKCTYNPDFIVKKGSIIYEMKGYWRASDRRKIREVLKQHPNLNLIMVFMDPNIKISKGSKTTYSQYCDKYNIKWTTLDDI